jgi:hypothetical protein
VAPLAKLRAKSQARITDMEGILLVIKAWALTAFSIWVHRRFFERVARAEPQFEAWCESEPLIAALRGNSAHLIAVEVALRARLGKRQRLIATLGGWPWPNYELEVVLLRVPGTIRINVKRAELRRTHGTLAPSLVVVLRDILNAHPGAVDDLWLLPAVVYGKNGASDAPSGWTILVGEEPKPQVRARATAPSWLSEVAPAGEASGLTNTASSETTQHTPSAKLLNLPSQC